MNQVCGRDIYTYADKFQVNTKVKWQEHNAWDEVDGSVPYDYFFPKTDNIIFFFKSKLKLTRIYNLNFKIALELYLHVSSDTASN